MTSNDLTPVTAADWVTTLRHSHDRLVAVSAGLTEAELKGSSYDTEWSVAQVLSHLGSGAEIFGLILDAALAGTEQPGVERFHPIWDTWNAKGPVEMRDDALASDEALVARLEGLTDAQVAAFDLALWGMQLDLPAFVRMRLAEHAVHTWDVAVSFDAAALVADDAVALLLPGLGQVASRSGKPADPAFRVLLTTTDDRGAVTVEAGESTSYAEATEPVDGTEAVNGTEAVDAHDGVVSLPSEALLRLVYGRLDPEHTPDGITASGTHGLDALRRVFQGF